MTMTRREYQLQRAVPRADHEAAVAAVEKAIAAGALFPLPRGSQERSALVEAARALEMKPNTLKYRLGCAFVDYNLAPQSIAPPESWLADVAKRRDPKHSRKPRARTQKADPPAAPVAPHEARQERLDAAYWRRKAGQLDHDLAQREADLRRAHGILERPVQPPDWASTRTAIRSSVAGLLHISDLHVGEVVRADEIAGVNEYNPAIFQRRIRRLFDATIEILPRWSADSRLIGVVIAVNGDLVSGAIHDELRRTNAIPVHEQAYLTADELTAGARKVKAKFGKVWITFTPGNHGRNTEKTHAKRTSALSYDMLVGEMVRRYFEGDPDVTVLLASGPDLEYPIFGWNVFQSHGDALGTGGGKGFAGPVLPIARGAKNVEWQAYRLHKRHDIILTAHYHTSSNPARGVLANGSVVGFNEYANRIRAGIEPPQQWLALVHAKWGIRERCEIQLDADPAPVKPRMSVTASMEPA